MLTRDLSQLANNSFDAVIVGGGIYGACIAREAALRGLSTALVEKADFGHATSANSMKIVHGGLRYLQHADINRMRRSSRERTALMRIAPHLVHPLPCLMPIYGHGLKGREAMAAALLLNHLISYDRNQVDDPQKHLPRGKVISADDCLKLFPDLTATGLSGAAIWYDAQMYNSERLTLSFILSAAEQGAQVANYVNVTGFLHENNRVTGVKVVDQLTGEPFPIYSEMVINASGPWIDHVLNLLSGKPPKLGIRLAKAVNIMTRPIFDKYAVGVSGRTPVNGSRSDTDRLLFVTPWRDQALIGTTYELYDEDPDMLRVTERDLQVLLERINEICPRAHLTLDDVNRAYCGLVPASDVNPQSGRFKRAGRYQIRDHRLDGFAGLISVLGVKYTTARNIAEKVIDRVQQARGENVVSSHSDKIPLYGGNIHRFERFVESATSQCSLDLSPVALRPLLYNYGTAYRDVLRYVRAPFQRGDHRSEELALLEAQIVYSVRHEMAQKLSDVIFRRTEVGANGHPGQETLALCAHIMADELGWSATKVQHEVEDVEEHFLLSRSTSEQRSL